MNKHLLSPSFYLIAVSLCLTGCYSPDESTVAIAEDDEFEQQPPITVEVTEVVPIGESPSFELIWSRSGRALEAGSLPVGSLHSRIHMPWQLTLIGETLERVSTETGEVLARAQLPLEIQSIHRSWDGDQPLSEFSYAWMDDDGDGVVVIGGTVRKVRSNGSASGVATAIYGSSTQGKILWCARVGLTHSFMTLTLPSGRNLVVVEDDEKQLVGITATGEDRFRVRLPRYDYLVIQESSSGANQLLVLGDAVTCYEFREP